MLERPVRIVALGLFFAAHLAPAALAGERVPGERWLQFADPAEAGFDAARLEAARETWEGPTPPRPSSSSSNGAVVAAWGRHGAALHVPLGAQELPGRALRHLLGPRRDRAEQDAWRTSALDDEPDPLLDDGEATARILDLLEGALGRLPSRGLRRPHGFSRPRGSEGPGRYFAYNNWDFNTLATILEHGNRCHSVFEAFDEHFGQPLSACRTGASPTATTTTSWTSPSTPPTPFRMSARDAARFGLLFARDGCGATTGFSRGTGCAAVRPCTRSTTT